MATYRDLITSTMLMIGVVAEGQSPSAAQAEDALYSLNALIDEWNSSDALLYTTKSVVEPFVPSQSVYTVGPGADIDIDVRPTRLYGAWVRNGNVTPNTDSPMMVLSDTEYGDIVAKTVTTTIPYYVYLDRQFPTGNLYVWPVPSSSSYSLVLQFLTPLNSGVTLATTESLPPAFRNALRWNLAVDLAIAYGQEPSQMIVNRAKTTKMLIQQANVQGYRMTFDDAANGLYSINSDSFRNY